MPTFAFRLSKFRPASSRSEVRYAKGTCGMWVDQRSVPGHPCWNDQSQAPTTFHAVTVHRAERFGPPNNQFSPPDRKDVVLWLEVENPPDDWGTAKEFYVQIGQQRTEPLSRSISAYSTDGKPPRHNAAFIIARDAASGALTVGTSAHVAFKIAGAVVLSSTHLILRNNAALSNWTPAQPNTQMEPTRRSARRRAARLRR